MKRDRNCGMQYPMYPNQGMMPPMAAPLPSPMPYPNYQCGGMNNIDQQLTLMQQQINILDKRVTKLEAMMNTQNNSNNQFADNNSNYHMM